MKYAYRYPQRVEVDHGRRHGSVQFNDRHLEQTHVELLTRLDDPQRSITVETCVAVTPERVWDVAGSAETFFSHQPRFVGLTALGPLGTSEGGRFVIHRAHEGRLSNRIGEVLVDMSGFQLTVSDIDADDASVSGHFPSLFTLRVEQDDDDHEMARIRIMYTTLGVMPALMPAVLLLQLRSISERAVERTGARP
jgi:hypothetical protein